MSDLTRNASAAGGRAPERLLSPREVAQACGLSRRAVYRAISRGELPAARLCNRLRVRPPDLQRWIAERMEIRRPVDTGPRTGDSRAPVRGSLRAMLDERQPIEDGGR
jgi:excisionase family DNA binding protein